MIIRYRYVELVLVLYHILAGQTTMLCGWEGNCMTDVVLTNHFLQPTLGGSTNESVTVRHLVTQHCAP